LPFKLSGTDDRARAFRVAPQRIARDVFKGLHTARIQPEAAALAQALRYRKISIVEKRLPLGADVNNDIDV